jgi:hypothetical protein
MLDLNPVKARLVERRGLALELRPVVHPAAECGRADFLGGLTGRGWRVRCENASSRPRLRATWATREDWRWSSARWYIRQPTAGVPISWLD